jgi:hypothetical protein
MIKRLRCLKCGNRAMPRRAAWMTPRGSTVACRHCGARHRLRASIAGLSVGFIVSIVAPVVAIFGFLWGFGGWVALVLILGTISGLAAGAGSRLELVEADDSRPKQIRA